MKKIDILLVDAFTDTPLVGNAATVLLDSEGLTPDICRKISAEVGVSESAFVSPAESEGADFRLRFYTPSQEIDLCGHATIAAFHAIASAGLLGLEDGPNRLVQETNLGDLPVFIEMADGKPERVMMGQKLPRFETPEISVDKLAALFGIGRKQMCDDRPVEIVSTGLRSLHVPVAGLSCFPDLKPLRRGLLELSSSLKVQTIQVFALEANDPNADAHCRVFAPAVGIEEDPGTGTAAGALGAYIVRHGLAPEGKDGITRLRVEQGEEIGRPGMIEVEVTRDGDEFVAVRIGGHAVISLRGKLRIPA
jgi:trans-2,3-dihydro-3-hydroxyanthranilate isomerase